MPSLIRRIPRPASVSTDTPGGPRGPLLQSPRTRFFAASNSSAVRAPSRFKVAKAWSCLTRAGLLACCDSSAPGAGALAGGTGGSSTGKAEQAAAEDEEAEERRVCRGADWDGSLRPQVCGRGQRGGVSLPEGEDPPRGVARQPTHLRGRQQVVSHPRVATPAENIFFRSPPQFGKTAHTPGGGPRHHRSKYFLTNSRGPRGLTRDPKVRLVHLSKGADCFQWRSRRPQTILERLPN